MGRTRRRASAMKMTLLPILLWACTPNKSTDTASAPPEREQSLYTVSETSTGKLLVANSEHGRVEGELCLSEIFPENCGAGSSELARPCLMFGVSHEVVDDDDNGDSDEAPIKPRRLTALLPFTLFLPLSAVGDTADVSDTC